MPHFYFSTQEQSNRLFKEWREHKKIVIAYDYDNTVFDYHGEGHDYSTLINLLRRCRDFGAHFVVFTAAEPERHDAIRAFLKENDIPVDVINENVPSVPFKLTGIGQKIYYNILLDDRAGLGQAFEVLNNTLKKMKKQLILDTNYFKHTPDFLESCKEGADALEKAMADYTNLSLNQYPPRSSYTHSRPYPVVPDHMAFDKNNVALSIHGYPIHSYVSLREDFYQIFYKYFEEMHMLHLLPKEFHKNLFRVSANQNALRYKQSRSDTISLDLPQTLQFFSPREDLTTVQYVRCNRYGNTKHYLTRNLHALMARALPISRTNFLSFSDTRHAFLMNVSMNLVSPPRMQNNPSHVPKILL